MSATHTITDDAILAAWNADVASHRDSVPLNESCEWGLEFWKAVAATTSDAERRRLNLWQPGDERRIEIVRAMLGGWDAVWRAALTDEGFVERIADRRWDYEGGTDWCLYVRRRPGTEHEWRLETWDWSIPLRSPADLRVRVGHARGLFGE